ncbi:MULTISPECIES: hypothetical protein [Streptomyces]|uniref:Sortase n=1 Tax=Streptomyces tsukubensis (strain DSM 42081 / NBRC 108919 / NRRL 18488 / 9993) TaxID=1114943 RepID=I2MXX4_STRT9|nr:MULTISPECIES: hypothetical protein [Streptomyces]AZK93976.1 hypothetical protein B7R87_08880 [Streptomyces tsukubensis]EIF89621.1 hypothetical protein [Streptomyces tsukubensis NRRL18488]MYS67156.1 hypothetical protein [Streptomyces sp. SID5473]QKM69906.1 hypothetical protein STSU_024930 [Streptomyces tsukubensis NRRL18488]TAI46120.1 hypothetical protein EWI31_03230 [Streptomyces tsukubensis]
MRTTARLLTSAALAVATTGLGFGAVGAYAAGDHGSLEVFPSTAEPGSTVTVNTTACGRDGHGTGDARALGVDEFHLSPGSHKDSVVGEFRVPSGIEAGSYRVEVRCKNGKRSSGDVVIRHRGNSEDQGGSHREQPSGHVRTGLGGSVGPDTTQIAAGAAVLAAAAVGGTLLLRRRARGAQGS